MTQDNDEQYLTLLESISTYDMLLDQLQKSMSEGFIDLGRANFHNKDSLRGRYGSDYYDESYEGLIEAHINGDGLFSIFKKNNEMIIDDDEKNSKDDESSEEGIKSRKTHVRSHESNNQKLKIRDPIRMFGAGLSIPSSLRQSQANFKSSVNIIFDLVNCRNHLLQDIQKISENNK
ncbi:similar to Saccharomyces cerevisiae YHR060W VMA22 Peripheral membrane protein that is required for vacuolar H+-ATPase (V-ATPase) function [Maudiozyma saulgeensis]|uniref:Vacuolar ATPase assembly protein VMA22 n=1 Tax=Maudiozyma saulgeensis TaxID=1789683 RepID=A0A1X7QYF7_9SACH|nr:similar to Saccharomyces cerevisiae YHR060W VMA22 Peripheral membrane protein that is required for vacuolar H+-ATPase (V-ATPase) function [Kazachstania saulgeensis]